MSEFPFPFPEEMRKAMEDHAQFHAMQADDYRHSVLRLFDELDQENLTTLHWMMRNLASTGSQLAQFYDGQLAMILYQKFNICPGCNVDHDQQMEEQLTETGKSAATSSEEPVIKVPLDLTNEQHEQMREYNIDDAYDQEGNFLGFICLGCGQMYPSIEDRMLKEPGPGGCSGCIVKTKWG